MKNIPTNPECYNCEWELVCMDPLRGLKDYGEICEGYLSKVQYHRSKAHIQRMCDEAREEIRKGVKKDGIT